MELVGTQGNSMEPNRTQYNSRELKEIQEITNKLKVTQRNLREIRTQATKKDYMDLNWISTALKNSRES